MWFLAPENAICANFPLDRLPKHVKLFQRATCEKTTLFCPFEKEFVYLRRIIEKAGTYKKNTSTNMRVLIVNTSEKTGGAAVAARRLLKALVDNGVKAKMLVRDKESEDIKVVGLPGGWRRQWNFLWERWCLFCHLHFRRKHLFEIDMANTGYDITALREFLEADVIHLHWVNQGMLSLKSIRKILDSGKPVVWTMHDLWPATSICHYARSCEAYKSQCQHCPLLPGGGGKNDLSARVWKRKEHMLDGKRIAFVACSQWLAGEARQSALLKGQTVTSIPNAIDTRLFCPADKQKARRDSGLPETGRLILFVSQRVTDRRKGMNHFIDAIKLLAEEHPELKNDTAIAILGGHSEELKDRLALPVHSLGYVSDAKRIAAIYNAADVFVLPSMEDNLPNTIMESLACGLPCVGFNVGGIPEMIDHQRNGYIAQAADAADLARGIRWVLCEADYQALCHQAVAKVANCYSEQSVALRYANLYEEVIGEK